jgi:hypothetical protein
MSEVATASKTPLTRFKRRLLEHRIQEVQGPEVKEGQEQHPRWQVVRLTGVDYFSTLAYTIVCLFRYIFFGEGDTDPVTHAVLREAETDPEKRTIIYVSGR